MQDTMKLISILAQLLVPGLPLLQSMQKHNNLIFVLLYNLISPKNKMLCTLVLLVCIFPLFNHFSVFVLQILKMEWGGEYSFDSSNLDCLLDVLPGELEFRQILSDLDEKIKKNSSR